MAGRKRRLPGLEPPKDGSPELRRYLENLREYIDVFEGGRGFPTERFPTLAELESAGLVTTKTINGRAEVVAADGSTSASPRRGSVLRPASTGTISLSDLRKLVAEGVVIDDLSDVSAPSPGDRHILRYNQQAKLWKSDSVGGLIAAEFFERDDTAQDVADRFNQIVTNSSDIIDNLAAIAQETIDRVTGDNNLQGQVNSLAESLVAATYVQDTEPVPGVGTIPDPIPDNARWYDSDADNHPYIWQPQSLVNSAFRWTATGNTGEFYVELAAGGDPGLTEPQQIQVNDTSYLTVGTPPLAASEWDWGDGGGGFNTVIVRLSDDADPDSKATDYVEAYRWLDLRDPRIGQNASDITALELTVNDGTTGVAANASAISALDTTVTTQGTSISTNASDIAALETTVNDPTTGVSANATAIGTLDTRVTAAEGSITTNATDIAALETTVNDPSTGVTATAAALSALDTRVTTAEGTISTNASDITALESTVNDGVTGVAANASAISSLDTRVTTAEGNISTNASDIFILESTVNDPTQGVAANASAVEALDTRVDVAEGNITTNASSITSLSSRVTTAEGDIDAAEIIISGHTTAISTAEGDIVALEARYGVRLNVNGYVSGFVQNNDGTTSDFIIQSDKFAVVAPGETAGQPGMNMFTVTGSNVYVNGNVLASGTVLAEALEATMVISNLIKTAAGTGTRLEIEGNGTYPLWYGSGAKTAANGKFYLDSSGNVVFKGLLDAALWAPQNDYYGVSTANGVAPLCIAHDITFDYTTTIGLLDTPPFYSTDSAHLTYSTDTYQDAGYVRMYSPQSTEVLLDEGRRLGTLDEMFLITATMVGRANGNTLVATTLQVRYDGGSWTDYKTFHSNYAGSGIGITTNASFVSKTKASAWNTVDFRLKFERVADGTATAFYVNSYSLSIMVPNFGWAQHLGNNLIM